MMHPRARFSTPQLVWMGMNIEILLHHCINFNCQKLTISPSSWGGKVSAKLTPSCISAIVSLFDFMSMSLPSCCLNVGGPTVMARVISAACTGSSLPSPGLEPGPRSPGLLSSQHLTLVPCWLADNTEVRTSNQHFMWNQTWCIDIMVACRMNIEIYLNPLLISWWKVLRRK